MKNYFFLLIILFISFSCQKEKKADCVEKPWAYWWWMGNSVTKDGITENLKKMADAGFGGVHIIPIYGEKGDESNFIKYLSPEWMEMLVHTADVTKHLGMGVDMTTGTGWPFGCPGIDSTYAAKCMMLTKVELGDKVAFDQMIHKNVVGYSLYDKKGEHIASYRSNAPAEKEQLAKAKYAVFLEERLTRQKVKRAAPGGEGLVMDYFSEKSIRYYMQRFEDAFGATDFKDGKVRAFYNDSYEVHGANYTDNLLDEFRNRRGYDLLPYLNLLNDTANSEKKSRVITDYCETISDLLYEKFTLIWVEKSHQIGLITRNQAHGSPGNILDLYGASDIPETESFGSSGFNIQGLYNDPDYSEEMFGRPNPLTIKFASSAANTYGKRLVSSETATWLADHFKVTLSQVKPQIDELFVSGINHVFYHGVTYSPPDKEFPGRLFYASTNFGPHSHFWNELPLLNQYITNCQTVLQNTKSDNDILLYFAIHEIWNGLEGKNVIRSLNVHSSDVWLKSKSTGKLSEKLWNKGFAFDYVSDKSIINYLAYSNNGLKISNINYKTIIVPATSIMPVETLKKLLDLAKKGATIYFENDIPGEVPGLHECDSRKAELQNIKSELLKLSNVVLFSNIEQINIPREMMTDLGLSYIRKQTGQSTVYFITNLSNNFKEGFIPLVKTNGYMEIYDPQNGHKGKAKIENGKILLQLMPGMSCFVTCSKSQSSTKDYPYYKVSGNQTVDLSYHWNLSTIKGEPVKPSNIEVDTLKSWIKYNSDFQYFSGTIAYSKKFDLPKELLKSDAFMLNIDTLKETATVFVNGKKAGTLWTMPNKMYIPGQYFKEHNTIELQVTNTSFNRVIDLDQRKVNWKNFHEINFVNILYKPYDASNKQPIESGMIGKVTLTPCSLF